MAQVQIGDKFMRKLVFSLFFLAVASSPVWVTPARGQQRPGLITGVVTDTDHDVLPGALIELDPGNTTVSSNGQGEFTIPNVAPGKYTLTVAYLGFSPRTFDVTVSAGLTSKVDAVLSVASQDQRIIVQGGRGYGEAEAVNEIRSSESVLNVLPAAVITSLPNANVADAVGRLPGVTLERDEGEGKYVQIRGTEPRLSNLTIDGVEVPSPEGGIRQVKLDVIPADLIESVQIYKTLQANQDGDAIGGTVNLVTKTAGERPVLSFFGAGGFTPIINTVPVSEFGATAGRRFGAEKRFGLLLSGSYDYNGRGINDIEPVPGVFPGTFNPNYTQMDIREYKFNRNRYGVGASADYKLGDTSLIYLHGLFSDFKDSGRRWAYTIVGDAPLDPTMPVGPTNPLVPQAPSFNTEIRAAHYQIGSILLGGNHVFGKYFVNWGMSVSRSRLFNPINGGESINTFTYSSTAPLLSCNYDPGTTKTVYRPQFAPSCYTNAYNPNNFFLSNIEQANHGQDSQLNLQAQVSAGRLYHIGSHSSQFETGFRIRNAHKFDDSFENFFLPNAGVNLPMTMFPSGQTDKHYYDGSYPLGPLGSWDKITHYFQANPNNFSLDTVNSNTYGTNPANFNLVERVTAGFVMNTIDFSRFTLVAGVRFEGTQFHSESVNTTTINPCVGLCVKATGSYIDVLPSASLRFRLGGNSALRLVYARGLSRPLPQELTTAISEDTSTAPSTFNVGAVLKPVHANNYDLLYERYLTPLGLIQAGFFYKDITNPIIRNVIFCGATCTTPQFMGHFVATPANAGSAWVTGVEFAFQQHFTYLPGPLSGLGVSGNYSYTASGTKGVNPLRSDNPPLLRQAPHTWNLSPTYDWRRLSIRVGMSYNGANIFQYQFSDLTLNPDGTKSKTPPDGGIKGPSGDNYLYAHFQIDAQGSYRLGKGWTAIVSALNLNNEVFGFYNGSPQFVVQREYYKPTYSFGFRWDLRQE
jgi:TonB-dependent receptor